MLELYDDPDELIFGEGVATNTDKTDLSVNITDNVAINNEKSCDNNKKVAIKGKRLVILDYLSQHNNATSKVLSQLLGISTARVKVYLSELEDAGLVIPHGANKNRTYSIK